MTLVGRTLGRYRLEELLGQGGMAEVYRAADTRLGRTVAVKVILATHARQEHFLSRFMQEAQLIARLEHPGILPVYDFGEEQGLPFLVMPYLEGGSLRDRMLGRPIPFPQGVAWVRQLAEALDAAHAAGVLHRDVKPANVLIGKEDRLILADFGIAKLLDQTTGLTATGTVVGTPIYMAPEQAQGRSSTPASDRYALAVIAWELLTGHPPYSGETALSVMNLHVTAPVPLLSESISGLPSGLDRVFERALAKRPEDRPPSCRALADQLLGFLPSGARLATDLPTTPWPAPGTGPDHPTRLEETPKHLPAAPPRSMLTSEPTVSTSPQKTARRTVVVAAALGGAVVALVVSLLLLRPALVRLAGAQAPATAAERPDGPVAPPDGPQTPPRVDPGRVEVVEAPAPPPPPGEAARLEQLTRAVTVAVEKGALTPPEAGNALEALAALEKEFPSAPGVPIARGYVAGALEGRGVTRLQKGDSQGARSDLERAQTLQPGNPDVTARLAELDAREAEGKAATASESLGGREPVRARFEPVLEGLRRATREDFEEAQRLAQGLPDDRLEPGTLAMVALAEGGLAYVARRDEEAGQKLVEAFSILRANPGPSTREALRWLPSRIASRWASGQSSPPSGWPLALAYGDAREEAGPLLEAELARNPSNGRALFGRAVLRRMVGQLAPAISDASRAWELNDRSDPQASSSVAYLLADLHRESGNLRESAEWLARALATERPVPRWRRERPPPGAGPGGAPRDGS